MLEISYYVAASLDGFIADEAESVDFLGAFEASGQDYGYGDFYRSIDALIMGRKTYDFAAGAADWPYPGKPCWVYSRQSLRIDTPQTQVTAATPVDLAKELESSSFKHVWLIGGGELAGAFQAQGLISDYIVSIIPVILGGGVPLLKPSAVSETLELIDTKNYPGGLVQVHYRRAS